MLFKKTLSVVISCILLMMSVKTLAYEDETERIYCDTGNGFDVFEGGSFDTQSTYAGDVMNIYYTQSGEFPTLNISGEDNKDFEISLELKTTGSARVKLQFDNGAFYNIIDWEGTTVRIMSKSEKNSNQCFAIKEDVGEWPKNGGKYSAMKNSWNKFRLSFSYSTGIVSFYWNNELINKYVYGTYQNAALPVFVGNKVTGIGFASELKDSITTIRNLKVKAVDNSFLRLASDDPEYNSQINVLSKLNIVPEGMQDSQPSRIITRQEAVSFVNGVMNRRISAGQTELPYTDVKKTNKYYSDIANAYCSNMISDNQEHKLRPGENITISEFLDLATYVLNIPNELDTLKNEAKGKLLKEVKCTNQNEYLNMQDCVCIIIKLLDMNIWERYYGGEQLKTESEKTVSEEYFNLSSVVAEITGVDFENRSLDTLSISGDRSYTYDIDSAISLLNIEGTFKKLYVNSDDLCLYMCPYKRSYSKWDCVRAVNNDKTDFTNIELKKISKIQWKSEDAKIGLSNDCKFFFNQEQISNNITLNLTRAYAKYVVCDNQIKRIYFFDNINTGGILSSKESNCLYYTTHDGLMENISDIHNYSNIITIMEHEEKSFSNLKEGDIIEYLIIEDRLYIFGSSYSDKGTVKTIRENVFSLNEYEYLINEKPVYIAKARGSEYKANVSISELLGCDVTIYYDMSESVRYIFIEDGVNTFFGLVNSGQDENDESILYVYMIEKEKMEMKPYKVKYPYKTYMYPFVSYQEAVLNAKTEKGFYKFLVKGDSIISIETVEKTDEYIAGGSIDGTYKRILIKDNGQSSYRSGNTENIIVLNDYLGQFSPRYYSISDFGGRTFNGSKIVFCGDELEPEAIIVTKEATAIRNPTVYSAILTDISQAYEDSDQTIFNKYSLQTNKGVISLFASELIRYGKTELCIGDILFFSKDGVYEENGGIYIHQNAAFDSAISFDDENAKNTTSYKYRKLGTMVSQKNGYISVENESGDKIWVQKNTTCEYLITNSTHDKFEKCSIEEMYNKVIYGVYTDDLLSLAIAVE